MPRAAAREASLIEQKKFGSEANPVDQGFVFGHIRGKSAGNQENSPQFLTAKTLSTPRNASLSFAPMNHRGK
jgi:hypothetical protein